MELENVGLFLCWAVLLGLTVGSPVDHFSHLENVRSFVRASEQSDAVRDLAKRILGVRSNEFEFEVDVYPWRSGHDFVTIESSFFGGIIKISGTSGVAVSFGLNHYLKYYCKKQISWAGDNLSDLPRPLPLVPGGKIELDAGVKYRYYQNVCTVSYSSVWWKWTRWEREIDWMSLNGINLPLAFTGQEAIWRRVFKQLGCTDKDLDDFFVGPAFLAWGRMGNINRWGGSLPVSWMDNQLALQHKILSRMKSLGMIPVLPGFAGFVPPAISTLYHVNVTRTPPWSHFNCTYACTYLLDPLDPLFTVIGRLFVEEQIIEYNGTNHIYNADMFNEMNPTSNSPTYLADMSIAVFNAMRAADVKAVWLMQGWMFRNPFWQPEQEKAFLTAVPQGRLIVLDLFSESVPEYAPSHSYFGQPFIWCMLHNFGGNLGFYGKIQTINKGPANGLAFPNSTMIGTGLTPEGINQNYFIYDLMLEVGFFISPRNLTDWVLQFTERRYGSDSEHAKMAWLLLSATAYNDTAYGYPPKSTIHGPIVMRPGNNLPEFPRWYDQKRLLQVWDEFMLALPDLPRVETVYYDVVDITRQLLQYIHFDAQYSLVKGFEVFDGKTVDESSARMLAALDDMNEVLLTNEHFLMGKWIKDARACGADEAGRNFYETNARYQVTLWGPSGEILDYANKEWASLVQHYYRPRWAFFVDHVKECVREKSKFNHTKFSKDIFDQVENPFTQDRTVFPSEPIGDSIAVAQKIYKKWRPMVFMNRRPK